MLEIRPARPGEAGQLTALAIRSKAHWGYDAAFLALCEESLAVAPADCASGAILVALDTDRIVGFTKVTGTPPVGELEDLWVDPDVMGRGVGRALLDAATARAREHGFRALLLDADPHAESFYLHVGATRISRTQSTVDPDRYLPRLRIDLDTGK